MKKCRYSLGRSFPWNWLSYGSSQILLLYLQLRWSCCPDKGIPPPDKIKAPWQENKALFIIYCLQTQRSWWTPRFLCPARLTPGVSLKQPHVWPKMSRACLETSPRMSLLVCGVEKENGGAPSAPTLAKLTCQVDRRGLFPPSAASGLGVSTEIPRSWIVGAERKQMAETIRNMEIKLFQVAECI